MAIDISDGQQDAKKMKAKVHEPPSILHKAVIKTLMRWAECRGARY